MVRECCIHLLSDGAEVDDRAGTPTFGQVVGGDHVGLCPDDLPSVTVVILVLKCGRLGRWAAGDLDFGR